MSQRRPCPAPMVALVGVLCLAAATVSARPQRGGPRVGPAPRWVERIDASLGTAPPEAQVSGGVDYVLVDRQTRVARGLQESYGHYAKKIVNGAGLGDASQLSIDFDPTYEALVLHQVRILREGQALDRMPRGRIETIQRESELEYQIYDGTLSAILFLEDVRVGDVIEYAYTLRGRNPILEDRYVDSFSLRWSVPVGHLRWRLLFPRDRTLHVKSHNTSEEPRVRSVGGETEYLWEERALPPRVVDKDAPAWHDDSAWVQLSDFASWGEVAAWGQKRFAVSRPQSRELLAEVDRLKSAGGTPESTVMAALHFVQDEIRYLGIEIGASSHQATEPSLVLKRRFGDCKDKSLLLVTLLRRLGITADPVLVNTERQEGLDAWEPTPFAFNHAVTRVEVGRRTYWLDPTRTAQGGTLERVAFPDYRRGLVVAPDTTALSVLPSPNLDVPTTTARETYVVKDSGPAEFKVETRYEGPEADRIRGSLRRRSRNEIERGYLDYYGKIFDGIKATAPLEVKDEPEANVIVTRESYEIPEFWSLSEDKSQWEFEVTASTIDGILVRPGGKARTAPLGLGQPVHVVHLTDVVLPNPWKVTPETQEVTGKAGRFSYASRYSDRKLQLEYHYRSLADAIAPADLTAYIKDVDRMRSLLSYHVWKPSATAKAVAAPAAKPFANWPIFAALGLFLPLLVVGCTAVCILVPYFLISKRVKATFRH